MVDQNKIREAVKLMLEGIGEDVNREGLIETPGRIARMYCEIDGDENMTLIWQVLWQNIPSHAVLCTIEKILSIMYF